MAKDRYQSSSKKTWAVGDRLTHRFNEELGPGQIVGVDDLVLIVVFPEAETTLNLAASSDALVPFEPAAGVHARVGSTGERVTISEPLEGGRCRLTDGREMSLVELWPDRPGETLVERLARGEIDDFADFSNRLDALHLAAMREAGGLGSFLGGRIELFAHQLYVAERACESDSVRWLLADEVGLGKTVEACLILNRLLRTGRVERVLVVVPQTLTVQWLGELWRKFHQVFVLLDEKRFQDVTREHGRGFNPFEAHARMVIALETLVESAKLTEQAAAAGIDLLVVDEAHHLRRPPGHPGDATYRAVAPIASSAPHALLLTASPLEDDAHGFFRLLQLLRPEEFPDDMRFEERLARAEPLPPCTSATRRADLGGLPPRRATAVDLPDDADWQALHALERAVRAQRAENQVARRIKAERLSRALASGAALEAVLTDDQQGLRELARAAAENDPRVTWLARQARSWKRSGQKTIVFVAHRESLELIRAQLSRQAQLATAAFHEDLSTVQRDLEVARFRSRGGPSLLISTECGGEGRNFQFCHRLVLFDLPWNPALVEQRIGRLDRIGRQLPVEIVSFRPPAGFGRAVARLYEQIGLFERPLGGLVRELAHVEQAIQQAAASDQEPVDDAAFASVVAEAREAEARIQQAAYHELHRAPYRPQLAHDILARVPQDLEELTAEVVLTACERLGFQLEPRRDTAAWYIEFGSAAIVDSLPGVPAGARFVGTFDREQAVEYEDEDFFASGHCLVEGILAELEDSPRGRVTLLRIEGRGERGFGLLAIYKRGAKVEAIAVDSKGRRRPDWVARLVRRPLRSKRVHAEDWTARPGWSDLIRKLAAALPGDEDPLAVAAVRIG
ncbi:MAG: DEAD/DEAH box helicase family protein [Acidobacteriota bacterium]|nr:MAG: DEAD/DEAH box helicase family protein [Acidobacteriota bacterium]